MPWPWWNVILLVTLAYNWQGNFSQEHLFLSNKLNRYLTAIKDTVKRNDMKKLFQSRSQKKLETSWLSCKQVKEISTYQASLVNWTPGTTMEKINDPNYCSWIWQLSGWDFGSLSLIIHVVLSCLLLQTCNGDPRKLATF